MATPENSMTAEDYRRRRDALGFTGRGAARFFRVDERTERYWTERGPIPGPVQTAIALLEALELDADKARDLVAGADSPRRRRRATGRT